MGHLIEINASYDGKTQIIESILIEVDSFGNILNTWDMGKIFRQYMVSNNDDPSKNGEDWCLYKNFRSQKKLFAIIFIFIV